MRGAYSQLLLLYFDQAQAGVSEMSYKEKRNALPELIFFLSSSLSVSLPFVLHTYKFIAKHQSSNW